MTWLAWIAIPFLPEAPRESLRNRFGQEPRWLTLLFSIAQAAGFLALFGVGCLRWQHQAFSRTFDLAIQASEQKSDAGDLRAEEEVTQGFFIFTGPIQYVAYLFTPAGFLLAAAFVDGMARFVAWGILNEPLGSVFLWVPWTIGRLAAGAASRERERRAVGAETSDEVSLFPSTGEPREMIILACRPKDWSRLQTIRYEGTDWRLEASGPIRTAQGKRYRYRLVRHPDAEVIRALVHYDPEREWERRQAELDGRVHAPPRKPPVA